jgi:hypothetical protein
VAEVLKEHVELEVESIDRMYLNVFVPRLQILEGALHYIRRQLTFEGVIDHGCGANNASVHTID